MGDSLAIFVKPNAKDSVFYLLAIPLVDDPFRLFIGRIPGAY